VGWKGGGVEVGGGEERGRRERGRRRWTELEKEEEQGRRRAFCEKRRRLDEVGRRKGEQETILMRRGG